MKHIIEEVGFFITTSKQDFHFLQGIDVIAFANGIRYDTENFSAHQLVLGPQSILEAREKYSEEGRVVL
jgi:hypothetical protein